MKNQKFPVLPINRLVYPYTYLVFILLNLLGIGIVFLIKKYLPPEIPLYYGRPFGQEQLAGSTYLTIPLLVAFAIGVFNAIISVFVNSRFLAQVLIGLTIATTLLAFITVLQIAFLVGSF